MIYFIILFIISIGALIDNRVIQKSALNRVFDFLLIFILIMNGLRHEIGAAWGLYLLRRNETKVSLLLQQSLLHYLAFISIKQGFLV